LAEPLTDAHRRRLDDLARRDNGKTTWLAWLRQSPVKPNSRHMLEHIERLKAAGTRPAFGHRASGSPEPAAQDRPRGRQMTPADLAKFEAQRRYATLVALAIEGMATVTDEIIDLHDRILGKLFNAAKNKHQQQFQASGKAINAKVRLFGRIGQALIEAKQAGRDPFAAIESVMSRRLRRERHRSSEARATRGLRFPAPHRRELRTAPLRAGIPRCARFRGLRLAAKNVLEAIEVLRSMNADNARKVPADAPTDFIKPRWQKLVMHDAGIDRRYYELCALSEMEEPAALRRHLGARLAPVQGLRGLPRCRPRNSPASNRPANCRWPWPPTATSTSSADAAGNAACHRQPHGRPTSCRTPSLLSRA
jgi:ribosome-associated translation inhibitor RaiA